MKPVRVVAFDESAATNWALPWHQDRVIALREHVTIDGFSNWSCKGGNWHCEPPIAVLQDMLFVRVHLDDADAEQAAMEYAQGSDQAGLVPADQAKARGGLLSRVGWNPVRP